jgi:hypothetical protein
MSLQVRRLIVLLGSAAVAAVLTWAVIYLRIPLGPVTFGFGTDVDRFAMSNVVLLWISLASAIGIWLDYFLDTRFLKS